MRASAPRLLGTLLGLLTACHASSTTDASASSTSAATEPAASSDGFVGCRPSAGECRASCPDGRFRYLDPDDRCPALGDLPDDRGACLCGDARDPAPPAPPEGRFVGCRPSAGECVMSCPSRRGAYVEPWAECELEGGGGCFCR